MKPMTNEERKAIVLGYLRAVDNQGVTETGQSILDLFADDAIVHYPKWGIARGKAEIGRMLMDVSTLLQSVNHHHDKVNWIFSGDDTVVCEGTSHGVHRDGPWQADTLSWGAGRWCDVFEIRDYLIHRCFVYLDPDYAGRDAARYPWIRR
jgi:hypothetical protein